LWCRDAAASDFQFAEINLGTAARAQTDRGRLFAPLSGLAQTLARR
jgi:hypothetical protein